MLTGNLMKTIRNPRGSAMGLVALDIIKDVVITTNSDCSFSLWDLSSGKEIHNQPFAGYLFCTINYTHCVRL